MRNHQLHSAPVTALVQWIGGALILVAVVIVLRWQRGDATTAPAAAPSGL